ncbi:MAG: response regulator, partial [Gammaproteobacteria bacterium]
MPGKHALIVDDSKAARSALRRMVEVHGLAVDEAESGEDALDYLRNRRPDVVFMDHMMPGISGLETVRLIKADPELATVPVVMYTSKSGEVYVGQARALGALDVLPKEVKPSELFRILRTLNLVPERREPAGDDAASPPGGAPGGGAPAR